jgi:hypothetical protein
MGSSVAQNKGQRERSVPVVQKMMLLSENEGPETAQSRGVGAVFMQKDQ